MKLVLSLLIIAVGALTVPIPTYFSYAWSKSTDNGNMAGYGSFTSYQPIFFSNRRISDLAKTAGKSPGGGLPENISIIILNWKWILP